MVSVDPTSPGYWLCRGDLVFFVTLPPNYKFLEALIYGPDVSVHSLLLNSTIV